MKYKFYLVLALLLGNTSISAKAQPIVFYSKRIVKNSRKSSTKSENTDSYIKKEVKTKVGKEKNVSNNNRKFKVTKDN